MHHYPGRTLPAIVGLLAHQLEVDGAAALIREFEVQKRGSFAHVDARTRSLFFPRIYMFVAMS